MRPTDAVVVDRVGGEAAVHEAHARLVALGMQRDLHRRGAGRDRMVLLLPAEREDDLLLRHHLDELARGLVLPGDEHPVDAAGARVDLGDRADPFDVLVGIGEERPDRLRGGVDHDLTDELGHRCLLCLVSSVSLGGLGHVAQPFEAGRPVVVEEVAELAHLVLARLVQAPGAVPSLAHEPGRLEHAEVLRDRRAGDVTEVVGDRRRRELVGPHQPQDLPASGLGQGFEGHVHTDYVSVYLRKCQLNLCRAELRQASAACFQDVERTGVRFWPDFVRSGQLPDPPQLRALAPGAQLLLALGRGDDRRVGGQVLAHVGERHLLDRRVGVVAGQVPAHLDDAPRVVGLVEPVRHAGIEAAR